jgi:hypothetical protein
MRLVLAQALRRGEEINHFLNRHRRRGLEILVRRHADVVGGGLGAGPPQLHVPAPHSGDQKEDS